MEIAVLIIIICVLVIGALIWEIHNLKVDLGFEKSRRISAESWLNVVRSQNNFQISALQHQVAQLEQLLRVQTNRKANSFALSKDVVDAVLYAMKKSHPDNGGNAEDFIRFKKVYDEVSRS